VAGVLDSTPAHPKATRRRSAELARRVDAILGLTLAREARAALHPTATATRETIPLAVLLDAARDQVAPRAARRPVAFRVIPAEGTVDVHVPALLGVLVVLIDHAIAVTPGGGRVAVTAQAVEDEVVFAIYDAAPSLGPADGRLERYWARAGHGRDHVERTVRAHGGRLWIDGYDGDGNVVLFTVPAPRRRATSP